MIKQGDYVVHIGIPPVEGEVVGCQVMNTFPKSYKLCVRLDDNRLYWDDINNWEVKDNANSDVDDVKFFEVD